MTESIYIELLNKIYLNEQFLFILNNYINNKTLKNYNNLIGVLNIIDNYINNKYTFNDYNINILVIDKLNKNIIYDKFSNKLNIEYDYFINLHENNGIKYADNNYFIIKKINNNNFDSIYLSIYFSKNNIKYIDNKLDYYYDNNFNSFNIDNNFNIKSSNIKNNIKETIRYNNKIEDKLNVIMVISNVCGFRKRIQLAKEFIIRMYSEINVELYIVELVYDLNPIFEITNKYNKKHLQLRTKYPLWHKENMVNIAVWKLLPADWKAFAWIDADIEFESESFVLDTLKLLNSYDIVQLFSHYKHMDKNKLALSLNSSFGYNYEKKNPYIFDAKSNNFWHPGFAWAMNRNTYEKIGGLFQIDILGGNDYHIALGIIKEFNNDYENNTYYNNEKYKYYKKCNNLKLGYTPGIIRHHYHGSVTNRQYISRYNILKNNNFDFLKHITFNQEGILVPTEECPLSLLNDILDYFAIRNEDE